jgi:YVTN family beta-propeller protein
VGIEGIFTFLISLIYILSVFVVMLSSFTHAQEIQELHQLTKHTSPGQSAYMTVPRPSDIVIIQSKIFIDDPVANSVSVIDITNDTKIKDIKGEHEPRAIAVDPNMKKVYVALSKTWFHCHMVVEVTPTISQSLLFTLPSFFSLPT